MYWYAPLQKRDVIAFPVEIAKIKAKLAEHDQQIHPIRLDNVKRFSDPTGSGESYWRRRTAIAFSFPSGRPLSRSSGSIVEFVNATGQLLSHKLKIVKHVTHDSLANTYECNALSFADLKTERIGYQVRTEGGSSGGPVFVTFGNDNPVVVAIHSESGDKGKFRNYGTLLWPFLQRTYFQED